MTNLKRPGYQFLWAVLTLTLATSVAKAQTYTDLHDFNETEGCCAAAPSLLAQGEDGDIYGATTSGGVHFYGNIFKMTTSGTVTDLHDFDLTHGGSPQGGISMGTDGNFYGTTYQGGHGYGTVFKITPSGTFTELYDFNNTTDGAYPKTPPVQAQDGNLYGTTNNGTIAVLYKITTSGTFTVMATLAAQSYSPLLLATDGNLYGTTLYGGTYNAGTVFQFSPTTKVLKTLFSFHTEFSPWGPLMQGVDGALYGTTATGGTGSGGVVYKITTAGKYTVLTNFSTSNSANGDTPYSGVVQGSDKFLYGVTSSGGANKLGVLFKISTTGTGYAVLHSFDTTTGDTPLSTPLLHTNGTIYGLTSHGGSHVPYGVAYSMNVSLKDFVAPVVLHTAKANATVELLGQGFNTATGVLFGTGSGTSTIVSDTYATAKIKTGATTGVITVKEPGGNLTTLETFKITPAIKSFSPTSGPVGTSVVITGTSLQQASAVKFGGKAATAFTVNSDTQVTATVPTGAVTGKIAITTPGGTATSSTSFTVN
jgi:uncharacterized repeat protein (TIGR03803 family)